MKDLKQVYLQLATALEKRVTGTADKRMAAILLRNATIQAPHCHFCGFGEEGNLYESRYHPTARICKLCALEIAETFKAMRPRPPYPAVSSDNAARAAAEGGA